MDKPARAKRAGAADNTRRAMADSELSRETIGDPRLTISENAATCGAQSAASHSSPGSNTSGIFLAIGALFIFC